MSVSFMPIMVSLRTMWLVYLTLASVCAEVLVNTAESVFTLSPSADIISFSNFTTNNPLDNLKDFPETFDIHEFSLHAENGTGEGSAVFVDQLAVESLDGGQVIQHHTQKPVSNSPQHVSDPKKPVSDTLQPVSDTIQPVSDTTHHVSDSMQHSSSSSFSQSVSVVRVTLPLPTVTSHAAEEETTQRLDVDSLLDTDAFSSLYEGVGTQWSDTTTEDNIKNETPGETLEEQTTKKEKFDSQLYDVVTVDQGMYIEPTEEKFNDQIEDEDQKYENLLHELQTKYGEGRANQQESGGHYDTHYDTHNTYEHYLTQRREHTEDMKHPLIMLMKIEPHALDLLVKPRQFERGTMVRLMYERVPRNRPPMLQHLDDPVVEYVPLHWPAQHHRLQDLPMGKYIVCGEAHREGKIIQANCFETVIDRLDNNMLQGGVVGVICVAIISIFLVIVYAIYYRLTKNKRRQEKLRDPESSPE